MSKRQIRAHRLYTGLGAFLSAISEKNPKENEENEESEEEKENEENSNDEETSKQNQDNIAVELASAVELLEQRKAVLLGKSSDEIHENFAEIDENFAESSERFTEVEENLIEIDESSAEKLENTPASCSAWATFEFFSSPKEILSESEEFFCSRKRNNFLKGVKWSPDGSCLLTNSDDHKLRVFSGTETFYQCQNEPPKDPNLV